MLFFYNLVSRRKYPRKDYRNYQFVVKKNQVPIWTQFDHSQVLDNVSMEYSRPTLNLLYPRERGRPE